RAWDHRHHEEVAPMIDVAIRTATMRGQEPCGDLAVAIEGRDRALLAMIDGLGHGAAAADASRLAGEVLREDPTRPVDERVTPCSRAARRARTTRACSSHAMSVSLRRTW